MIKKNILICPLDWGLGHASRCVPVINKLLNLGHHVTIGSDKNPLAFLKQEFPHLPTVVIPGYEVTYDKKGSSIKLFCESLRFYNFIKKEHQMLQPIIDANRIDVVISDNRYGLWSQQVRSIIITHQLFVKTPFGRALAHKKIEKLLGKFDETWIPDVKKSPNLSGELSHLRKFLPPHQFIGPLSRFTKQLEASFEFDVMAVLSGPEPQRTIFEELLLDQINKSGLKTVLVRGLPMEKIDLRVDSATVKVFNHLGTEDFLKYLQKSKVIICRAGYSSIMDLVVLGKKAALVPTPGQPEQEYLGNFHKEQGSFYSQKQADFDLKKVLREVENYAPIKIEKQNLNLDHL